MQFALCNEMFEGWAVEDVFRAAAELGYQGVEIAPFTLAETVDDISSIHRKAIVRAAETADVEIVGLHWLLKSPEGLYINHPDAAVRARTREYLESLIRLCGDLGGKALIFGSPKQRDVHPELTYEQAWEYARDTFAHCGETAQDVGVYFCLEALARRETDFINTVPEALRMIREVDRPHFRTMVDTKAISDDGRPFAEIINEAGGMIKHVHANDASGRGPGIGETDLSTIPAALDKIGYDGYVSVEVFDFKPDPVTIARESLTYLKSIWKKQVGEENDNEILQHHDP